MTARSARGPDREPDREPDTETPAAETPAATFGSWEAVQAEALRRIADRVWRPGDLIPGEAALAEEFGCARATVGRALRALAAAGLVDRRRKAGTRVAVEPVRRATLEIPVVKREVEARGMAYGHRLLQRGLTAPPAAVAGRLGLGREAPLLHLESLHLADGRPWAFEDRWVNPAATPGVLEADLDRVSPNEWLVLHAPFSSCDLAFGAETATAPEAALLETAAGSALFVTERTTWIGRRPITYVRMIAPPGYRLRTRL